MRSRPNERGVVAIMTALIAPVLLVAAALVVDLGMVRVDRQANKSAADAAALAGLHSLDTGDGRAHPYVGVCAALSYLQTNGGRFAGVTANTGSWSTGAGATAPNGCTDSASRSALCVPGSPATWAKFDWTGTASDLSLHVTIQSGYQLSASSGWTEDALPAAEAETDDEAQGCSQLAVIISQSRPPGLGSLATTARLGTRVRSVGRVHQGPGGAAPAMLLLKRTGCPALQVGSVGGGADSYVHVYGSAVSNGRSQPGTIHSDSDGSGCSGAGGNWLFYGKAESHIVAYAGALPSNPLLPDPAKPGIITSAAAALGVSTSITTDATANVYGSSALNEAGATAEVRSAPSGRQIITRSSVDAQYAAGVRAAISAAQSEVFGTLTADNAVANGYTKASCSSGVVTTLPALTAADKLFVDCPDTRSIPMIQAGVVVFSGTVNPANGSPLRIPNAHHVYVFGASDAVTLGSGSQFRMHTAGMTDALGNCLEAQATAKALLVVRTGGLKQTGGDLQLCGTTVILMGGPTDGCLPATSGTAPTSTPCVGTAGTGQLKQVGGDIDWTAPNQHDAMTLPNGEVDPIRSASWADANGPEDLALWTESASNSSDNKASMGGGSLLRVRGVFMTPNFDPFTLGGNGLQTLRNAQYVASSIALSGGVQLSMSVDPNSAVTLPKLLLVGLIR